MQVIEENSYRFFLKIIISINEYQTIITSVLVTAEIEPFVMGLVTKSGFIVSTPFGAFLS